MPLASSARRLRARNSVRIIKRLGRRRPHPRMDVDLAARFHSNEKLPRMTRRSWGGVVLPEIWLEPCGRVIPAAQLAARSDYERRNTPMRLSP
jgi:hypothetical protein